MTAAPDPLQDRIDAIAEICKRIEKTLPEWAWEVALKQLLASATDREHAAALGEGMAEAMFRVRELTHGGGGG